MANSKPTERHRKIQPNWLRKDKFTKRALRKMCPGITETAIKGAQILREMALELAAAVRASKRSVVPEYIEIGRTANKRIFLVLH